MSLPDSVIAKVNQLANEDRNVRLFLEEVASRERPRQHTDMYRVYHKLLDGGYHLTNLEMAQVGEKLQRAGVGKFIPAKFPKNYRFEWAYNCIEVGKAGLGRRGSGMPASSPAKGGAAQPPTGARDGFKVVLQLEGDRSLVLSLPRDFNKADATKLATQLMALARQNEAGEL